MRRSTFLPRRHQKSTTEATYQVTDRLHEGRTARVPAEQISSTITAWLSELGTSSPLVEELARAVREGDWPATHTLCERLSVDVAIAAQICPGAEFNG